MCLVFRGWAFLQVTARNQFADRWGLVVGDPAAEASQVSMINFRLAVVSWMVPLRWTIDRESG